MRCVGAILSGAWSFGWFIGQRFGWDTLLTSALIVVGSICAVFMV